MTHCCKRYIADDEFPCHCLALFWRSYQIVSKSLTGVTGVSALSPRLQTNANVKSKLDPNLLATPSIYLCGVVVRVRVVFRKTVGGDSTNYLTQNRLGLCWICHLQHKLPTTTDVRKLVHKLRTRTSEPMSTATCILQTTHTWHDLKRKRQTNNGWIERTKQQPTNQYRAGGWLQVMIGGNVCS